MTQLPNNEGSYNDFNRQYDFVAWHHQPSWLMLIAKCKELHLLDIASATFDVSIECTLGAFDLCNSISITFEG